MIFTQSEGTAARRRFPLYLVDANDGITPETGEATGQPQISKNGGAWGNTSATLTAVGNGSYYVELTAGELDTLGSIQIRYKSAATAEFNAPGMVIDPDIHDSVRFGLTALPNAAADAAGGLPISDAGGLDLDALNTAAVRLTAARAQVLDDWINAGRLDAILDTIAGDVVNIDGAAMRGTDNAALASVLGALNDAAAAGDPTASDTVVQYLKQLINILVGTAGVVTFPAEAAPANAVSLAEVLSAIHADVTGLNGDAMRGTDGANTTVPDAAGTAPTAVEVRQEMDSNSTKLASIETDTQDLQTRTPAALVGGRMDANVGAISEDSDAADNLEASLETVVASTCTSNGTTTTIVDTSLSATNDFYNGRIVVFRTGNLAKQATDVTDYDGGTKTLTVTALTGAPQSGDAYAII